MITIFQDQIDQMEKKFGAIAAAVCIDIITSSVRNAIKKFKIATEPRKGVAAGQEKKISKEASQPKAIHHKKLYVNQKKKNQTPFAGNETNLADPHFGK